MIINGEKVYTNGYFAYDGCHKIYVTEDEEDMMEAERAGYSLFPIDTLETAYNTSCPLRFISNWKLTKKYLPQFAEEYGEVTFDEIV